jgi:hypothetical protein
MGVCSCPEPATAGFLDVGLVVTPAYCTLRKNDLRTGF